MSIIINYGLLSIEGSTINIHDYSQHLDAIRKDSFGMKTFLHNTRNNQIPCKNIKISWLSSHEVTIIATQIPHISINRHIDNEYDLQKLVRLAEKYKDFIKTRTIYWKSWYKFFSKKKPYIIPEFETNWLYEYFEIPPDPIEFSDLHISGKFNFIIEKRNFDG